MKNIFSNVTTLFNDSILKIFNLIYKVCKIENMEDKYHKDLFNDYYNENPKSKTFYNGLLFNDVDMLKVLENEGYIQMYNTIKKSKTYKNNYLGRRRFSQNNNKKNNQKRS